MLQGRFGLKGAVALAALLLFASACSNGSSGSSAGAGVSGSSGASSGASGSSGSGSGGRYGYGSPSSGGSGGGGGSSSSSTGNSVMTIDQNNFSFDPATFTVKAGATITIKDANANTPHTFTIKGTNVDVANNPLQSQDVKIDLQPGTYQFICRYHFSSYGMKGTITVT